MGVLAVSANERHELLWLGQRTDPLLGHEWHILGCPLCGHRVQICWRPFKKIVLEAGEDDLTAEDVERIMDLAKAGRREEAKALMASHPGHFYNGGVKIRGVKVVAGDDSQHL